MLGAGPQTCVFLLQSNNYRGAQQASEEGNLAVKVHRGYRPAPSETYAERGDYND